MKTIMLITGYCAAIALTLGFAGAIDGEAPAPKQPSAVVAPPLVRHIGAREAPGGNGQVLVFRITNPNADAAVPFYAYMRAANNPPVREGIVSPLFTMEKRAAGEWTRGGIGWCGTGAGPVRLDPLCSVEFTVHTQHAPGADAIKIGINWFKGQGRDAAMKTAWSGPVVLDGD